MKVLWNKKVQLNGLWMPECFGLFAKQGNHVTFFFEDRSKLLSISEADMVPQLLYCCSGNESLRLPSRWAIVETLNTKFLLISDDQALDLTNNEVSCDIPVLLQEAYKQQVHPPEYYVEAPQQLGEFTILHKGNWGYICKREDAKLWEFTGKAYLYTDMMRWNDRLFFGTGGHGGYFYVLDIHTGLPLATIKTGGTRCFVQVDNLCYVLRNEKNAQLLCVDLSDGQIVSQCDLPGIATIESRITIIDNLIHVITFNISRSKSEGFTWSCVKI